MSKLSSVCRLAVLVALVGGPMVEAGGPKGLLTVWETTPLEQYDLAVTSNGSVWVASDDKVYLFDPVDGSATSYAAPFLVAPDFAMITPAPDGSLWMSDSFGERIVRFNPSTGIFTPYTLPKPPFAADASPFGITVGPDGKIWFTTGYSDYGLGCLDPVSGTFTRFQAPGGADRGMPVMIAFDSAGMAWFTYDVHSGGDPGLGRLNPGTGSFSVWTDPYAGAFTPFGLVVVDDEIWFLDHSANVLVHFEPASEVFTTYPNPSNLVDPHFLALGHDGLFYTTALASRTLGAFDPVARRWMGVRSLRTHPNANAMGVTTAPDGAIWFAADTTASYDFGGIGRFVPFGPAGLAVGAYGEDAAAVNSGAVSVLFGSTTGGLGAVYDQWVTQDGPGMADAAEASDRFGYSLTSGDFNCDTVLDLAIGVEGEEVNGHPGAGAVHVVYGMRSGGLYLSANQLVHQDTTGILEDAEDNDSFGWTVAAGDFDRDGCGDLAVGVPAEDRNGIGDAGIVNVVYGSPTGLTLVGNQIFWQDTAGMQETAEAGDRFGHALATGDFDGDGFDDLAFGVPWEDLGSLDRAGVVQVVYGTDIGLTAARDQLWHQDVAGMPGDAASEEDFGWELAVGDFQGDGYDDLAIGVSGEDVGSAIQAGAVTVLHGAATTGLVASGQLWTQDSAGIEDTAEDGDAYGHALAGGDFDGDGYGDLAVAVPFEGIGSATWAGAVSVLYGTSGGLGSAGDQLWHQDVYGLWSSCESWDRFGFRVAAADFNFDGADDLVVGIPYEDIETTVDGGAVQVLYGSPGGLAATGTQAWYQGGGIADIYETEDYFGYAVAPLYVESSLIFADGFVTGTTAAWSSALP